MENRSPGSGGPAPDSDPRPQGEMPMPMHADDDDDHHQRPATAAEIASACSALAARPLVPTSAAQNMPALPPVSIDNHVKLESTTPPGLAPRPVPSPIEAVPELPPPAPAAPPVEQEMPPPPQATPPPPPPPVNTAMYDMATPPQSSRNLQDMILQSRSRPSQTPIYMQQSVPPSPIVEPGALHELEDFTDPGHRRSSAAGAIAGLEELRNRVKVEDAGTSHSNGFDQLLQATQLGVVDAYMKLEFEGFEGGMGGGVCFIKTPSVVLGRADGSAGTAAYQMRPDGSLVVQSGPSGFGDDGMGTKIKKEKKKRKKKKKGGETSKSKSTSGASSSAHDPQFIDPFQADWIRAQKAMTRECTLDLPPRHLLPDNGGGQPPKKNISRRHARLSYDSTKKAFQIEIIGKNGAFIDGEYRGRGEILPLQEKTKVQIGGIAFSVYLPPQYPVKDEPDGEVHIPSHSVKTGGKMSFSFHDEHGNEVKTDPSESNDNLDHDMLAEDDDLGVGSDDEDSGQQSDEEDEGDEGDEGDVEDSDESEENDEDEDEEEEEIEPSPSPEPVADKKRGRGRPKKSELDRQIRERERELEREKKKQQEKERQEEAARREKEQREKEKERERERERDRQEKEKKKAELLRQKQEKQKLERQREKEERHRKKEEEKRRQKEKAKQKEEAAAKKEPKLFLPTLAPPESKPEPTASNVMPEPSVQTEFSSTDPPPQDSEPAFQSSEVQAYPQTQASHSATPTPAIDPALYMTETTASPVTPGPPSAQASSSKEPKQKKEKPPPKRKQRSPSPEINEADLPPEALLKPAASYVVLIHEALSNSEEKQLSLPQIYKAIERRYPYYKLKVPTMGWQSSVRHNLGQHKAFHKVERAGKGWVWGLVDGVSIEKERKGARPQPAMGEGMMQYPGQFVPHTGYGVPQGSYAHPAPAQSTPPALTSMHQQKPNTGGAPGGNSASVSQPSGAVNIVAILRVLNPLKAKLAAQTNNPAALELVPQLEKMIEATLAERPVDHKLLESLVVRGSKILNLRVNVASSQSSNSATTTGQPASSPPIQASTQQSATSSQPAGSPPSLQPATTLPPATSQASTSTPTTASTSTKPKQVEISPAMVQHLFSLPMDQRKPFILSLPVEQRDTLLQNLAKLQKALAAKKDGGTVPAGNTASKAPVPANKAPVLAGQALVSAGKTPVSAGKAPVTTPAAAGKAPAALTGVTQAQLVQLLQKAQGTKRPLESAGPSASTTNGEPVPKKVDVGQRQ